MGLLKKFLFSAATVALSASIFSSVTLPTQKVSARADDHYFMGVFNTNVSDYLTIRQNPNYSSADLAHIPAGSLLYIDEVSGCMGKIDRYTDPNGHAVIVRDVTSNHASYGWVNLRYADENYVRDNYIYGKWAQSNWTLFDNVPSYYSPVTWRVEQKSWGPELSPKLWTEFQTTRSYVYNDKMGVYRANNERKRVLINGTYQTLTYNGEGYYNLDYMATWQIKY
ncbi:MAG: hypothetical protein Q4F95_04030 [Oscillospiraceae bacterium]|nr:hypothetical protein [Oscillospiraceae bacterium]